MEIIWTNTNSSTIWGKVNSEMFLINTPMTNVHALQNANQNNHKKQDDAQSASPNLLIFQSQFPTGKAADVEYNLKVIPPVGLPLPKSIRWILWFS